MAEEAKSGLRCVDCETLMSAAIDQSLTPAELSLFTAHLAACASCRELYQLSRVGAGWLAEVEEIEPPATLVHNILARTSERESEKTMPPRRGSAWLRPLLTPRFAMSLGMAFFSITLTLNVAQIRITDLTARHLARVFYSHQNKARKYYENLRVVQELDSRMRDLHDAAQEEDEERRERDRRRQMNKDRSEIRQPGAPAGHAQLRRPTAADSRRLL